MADQRALVIRGGDYAEVLNADAIVVGTGVKAAGSSNLTLTPGTAANVRVSGDSLVLNGDHSGSGQTTYLYVFRDSAPSVAVRWNEADDKWQCSNDGSTWRDLGIPTGTTNQHLEYIGSSWTAVDDLTLPAGSRTIDIASAATGSQLQVAGGTATTTNNDGGALELVAGAPGGGTGVYGDVRIGTNSAGAARASTIRIGYDDSGGNQIEVDTANYATDLNGNISFGAADPGTRITTDIVWSHSSGGERRLRVMPPTTADADSNTIKIEGGAGSNNASGNGYKGTYLYLDAGAGGNSTGSNGAGGDGGGSDYYGGIAGDGNGTGSGGNGGRIVLHGGDGGAGGVSGGSGNGADIALKPGRSPTGVGAPGFHGATIVGNPNTTDFTYLLFDSNDGVGGNGSDPADGPGFRWSVGSDVMQVYTGATGAGSWSDVATSASSLIGYTNAGSTFDTALGQGTAAAGGTYRVLMGYGAGASFTTTPNAVVVGAEAADAFTTGGNDITVIGRGALGAGTSASGMVVVGMNAAATEGTWADGGVYIGKEAGFRVFGGDGEDANVAVGTQALYGAAGCIASSDTWGHVAVGEFAMQGIDTGYNSVAVGHSAARNAANCNATVTVGHGAGRACTSLDNCVIVGAAAALTATTITDSTIIGAVAAQASTSIVRGVYIGVSAGQYAVGSDNILIGTYAGLRLALGTNEKNVAIGTEAMNGVVTTTTGVTNNTAVGYQTMHLVTTADNCCTFGSLAGQGFTAAADVIAIGVNSGKTLTTGSDGIYIGTGSGAGSAAASNEIVIGHGVTSKGDDTTIIGTTSVTDTWLHGNNLRVGNESGLQYIYFQSTSASDQPGFRYNGSVQWSPEGTTWYDFASGDGWIKIPTSDYTATPPAGGATITMSQTDWFDVIMQGTPIKWLVEGGLTPPGVGIIGGSPFMISAENLTGLAENQVAQGGAIYVDCVSVGGNIYRFDLYNNGSLASKHMVATTGNFDHTTSAARTLTEMNSSGLTGTLTNVASGCRAEIFALIVMWAGIVESIVNSAGTITLTIGGAPLIPGSASIRELWVGTPDKVRREKYVFGNNALSATTDTFCNTAKVAPWESPGPYSQLVKFRVQAADVTTGTARVNLMNNGNEVSSTSSFNGLLIPVADTWYETGVDIDRQTVFVTTNDEVNVAVKATDATANYLTVEFYHVVL